MPNGALVTCLSQAGWPLPSRLQLVALSLSSAPSHLLPPQHESVMGKPYQTQRQAAWSCKPQNCEPKPHHLSHLTWPTSVYGRYCCSLGTVTNSTALPGSGEAYVQGHWTGPPAHSMAKPWQTKDTEVLSSPGNLGCQQAEHARMFFCNHKGTL